jgi:hypothetical protein
VPWRWTIRSMWEAVYYWEISLDKVISIEWMPRETTENSQKIQYIKQYNKAFL